MVSAVQNAVFPNHISLAQIDPQVAVQIESAAESAITQSNRIFKIYPQPAEGYFSKAGRNVCRVLSRSEFCQDRLAPVIICVVVSCSVLVALLIIYV